MYEVKMPRLGVTMQNGTVTEWLIKEGEEVAKGEYLFELETEKSTLEIEAQEAGVLKKIIVPPDVEVPVNTVIAVIAGADEEVDLSVYSKEAKAEAATASTENEKKPEEETEQKTQTAKRGGISPRARKLAKELGVSLEHITGTGKDGIVTELDVQNAASNSGPTIKVRETIPLNNIKKVMADNMLTSWQSIPQFTQMVSVNMEQALKVKNEIEGISINDLIVKTVANAVKAYPFVNSKLEKEKEITVYDEVNVSIAINSAHGLVVPVVKNTEQKTVQEISAEIKQLAEKAEGKNLSMDDYAGGTITISNLGSLGIESGTPIVNSPQSTIVFVGAIKKTPIVNEQDDIKAAPMMVLSICYDHRFIDGVAGARFTNEVKEALETLTAADLI
ncbi:dihydrolipoamide acetyltransferase family protein [Planococcus ruber]|uniref:dihydrolipoamide acetyltransferase family protein n=1 Tax=Planococcus ruber TaxID=2027871 RepID=UPI001FEEA4C4|nr:dihydrolipoamide acetyltransferase family protein [Planococcus ruber]MCJ1907980.1 2-oxo acid dehydrogenase subunit E2 [Planococcus ruber]